MHMDHQVIYALSVSFDLPLDIIPLAADIKINLKHKCPKSLIIPNLNTTYDGICVPKVTVFGTLNPIEIESSEICSLS